MQVSDTQAAVIAGVRALFPGGGGGGYNQVYDLFLPLGQDTCQSNGGCYSPDVPSTFTFCAYHSSMNAPDAMGATIHVLYTVMPYQRVPGCQVTNSPYPNGQLADSTNSVLSHEIEELISDPDGNAWWESSHSALHGSESGDICAGEAQKFNLNDKLYDIQLNYDNASHSCASKSSYPSPKCIVQLNKTSFVNNDQVIASVLQVVNPASTPVAAAYNLWIDIPGYEPFPFARGGSDGSVTFAAGTANYGPLTLFTVSSGLPRGNYNFGCRLDDPVTGATQGQTVVPFTIN